MSYSTPKGETVHRATNVVEGSLVDILLSAVVGKKAHVSEQDGRLLAQHPVSPLQCRPYRRLSLVTGTIKRWSDVLPSEMSFTTSGDIPDGQDDTENGNLQKKCRLPNSASYDDGSNSGFLVLPLDVRRTFAI
jgi:hypothetical protein